MAIYLFSLFVLLSPGILLTFPPSSSHIVVVIVHAIIFVIILELTYKPLWHLLEPNTMPIKLN